MGISEIFGPLAKAEKDALSKTPALFAKDGQKIEYVCVVFATLDWDERDFAGKLCTKHGGIDGGRISHQEKDETFSKEAFAYLLPPERAEEFREAVYTMIDFYRSTIQKPQELKQG